MKHQLEKSLGHTPPPPGCLDDKVVEVTGGDARHARSLGKRRWPHSIQLLARLRREVEPVERRTFARFAVRWQGVTVRRRGLDALLDSVETLQGTALLASELESEILPARVADYRSGDLEANHNLNDDSRAWTKRWDKERNAIVNNESAEIIRMFA